MLAGPFYLLNPLREDPSLSLPASGSPWGSLVCRCITPVSASIFTRCFPFCLGLHMVHDHLLRRTTVITDEGPVLFQYDITLTNYICNKVLVAQLCDPMVCSPPGSSVHGILQARIPEWVASPFSRGSSQPRD